MAWSWGAPAFADVQFAYSQTDNIYGICAGCGPNGATKAIQSCRDGGGADCRAVLGCGDGWAAVAGGVTDGVRGAVGISCGIRSEAEARILAWSLCSSAYNRSCNPEFVITLDGEIRDDVVDDLFATFVSQAMLGTMGYPITTPDGLFGPETLAALNQFQRDMSLPETSTLTRDDSWLIWMAFGGRQKLRDLIRDGYATPTAEALAQQVYVTASAPQPREGMGDEIAGYADDVRRYGLTIFLRANGHPCTDLAETATNPMVGDNVYWNVVCPEATYNVFLQPDGSHTIESSPR
jgi:peptidoglycan hydrolase-like protein with peptidoglycan-binding domain